MACLINSAAAGYCESTVCYKLTADIALNDWTDDGGFSNQGGLPLHWTPIGGNANPFRGTLDGGSNTVSGIFISMMRVLLVLFRVRRRQQILLIAFGFKIIELCLLLWKLSIQRALRLDSRA